MRSRWRWPVRCRRLPAPGIAEIVPAARTVLVRFAPGRERPDIATLLSRPTGSGGTLELATSRAPVELPVRYDRRRPDASWRRSSG